MSLRAEFGERDPNLARLTVIDATAEALLARATNKIQFEGAAADALRGNFGQAQF